MKVIVCGAGQVGSNIARHLSLEHNDVTVIDQSPELIRNLIDTVDVQGVVGHASRPNDLERAGAADSDMIIAVTYADEINMLACQIAHSLFDIPTKIARVRHQSYLEPRWANLFSRDQLPIDVIISPEIEVARSVARRLRTPGAFETISLADEKVKLLGVRCDDDCPLINTPLRHLTQLFPDLNIIVVGIVRDGKPQVPSPEEQLLVGDEVYFIVATSKQGRAMAAFGHEETEARRLLIFGGGNIGLFLAEELEKANPPVNVKIIEHGRERAELISGKLKKTTVINGDALDSNIQGEANIRNTETVIAVTNDDETNILSSLLAKRSGCQRVITLINNEAYEPLISTLGIDVVLSPRNMTVSSIIQHVRRGRIHAVHSLRAGFGEVIEADAMETSPLVGVPLRDADLPNGVLIGALVRDGDVITPGGDTVIQAKDRIVLFSTTESISKVEKLFSVQLEFF